MCCVLAAVVPAQPSFTSFRYVADLVERHFKYGVQLVHYDIVLGAIHTFLGTFMGGKCKAEDAAAWGRVLNVIKLVAKREYGKA